MNKYIPTGGPAFPIECNIENGFRDDSGMTLRDYFAARAMNGMYAGRGGGAIQPEFFDEDARLAYAMADAMLAQKFKAEEMNAQERKDRGDDVPW